MRQAFRELRAELVNVRTVVAWRRARVVLAMGRQKLAAPSLLLSGVTPFSWVLHQFPGGVMLPNWCNAP